VYVALLLFVFAIASPFLGLEALKHQVGGDTPTSLFLWILLGMLASIVGATLAAWSARRKPLSWWTVTALVIGALLLACDVWIWIEIF
jgi:hypothetical protein